MNCLKCVSEGVCETCINNYYLSIVSETERVCKEKTKVSLSLSALNNPKIFRISLSDSWPELLENITKKLDFVISAVSSDNFTCLTSKEGFSKLDVTISCNYKTNITAESTLTITLPLPPTNSETSSHFLINTKLSIPLSKYIFCGDGVAWREG